ncbi:MAG TPA: phosphatase PAP2 family protein [Pseudolabrys sp.]|nr:phosphatase PAP2 family protein [Pseudolabrys sp.]
MNRTGLIAALIIAAVVGIVFGLYPDLDLRIAEPFYRIDRGGNLFGLRLDPLVMTLRDAMLWLVTIAVAVPGLALAIKLVLPRRKLLVSARAIVFLIATMALGPGLLTNGILKEHWGRSRPIDVTPFNGQETFVPWWDVRGDCPNNCSFVSGDVSGAAWLFAPAALAPPPWRPLAYAGAFVFTAAMGAIRIGMGGHFFTDTVFAGVFTFLVIWLCYALIYRWPRTRLRDEALERGIERLAMPGYRFIARLFGRRKS